MDKCIVSKNMFFVVEIETQRNMENKPSKNENVFN